MSGRDFVRAGSVRAGFSPGGILSGRDSVLAGFCPGDCVPHSISDTPSTNNHGGNGIKSWVKVVSSYDKVSRILRRDEH